MSAPLDTHGAVEAIKVLKARYFRYIDSKQWTDLRALFVDDLHFEHAVIGTFERADAATAAIAARIGDRVTVHHGHSPEVEVSVDGWSASGIWALHSFSTPGPDAPASAGRQAYGHYYDEFTRSADGWLICSVRLVHLYKEPW